MYTNHPFEKNLLVEVKTKSNYRKLNGKLLQVNKFNGTYVDCNVFCQELDRVITVSFNLSEVVRILENREES